MPTMLFSRNNESCEAKGCTNAANAVKSHDSSQKTRVKGFQFEKPIKDQKQ